MYPIRLSFSSSHLTPIPFATISVTQQNTIHQVHTAIQFDDGYVVSKNPVLALGPQHLLQTPICSK